MAAVKAIRQQKKHIGSSCNHLGSMTTHLELSSPAHVGAENIWVCICPEPSAYLCVVRRRDLACMRNIDAADIVTVYHLIMLGYIFAEHEVLASSLNVFIPLYVVQKSWSSLQ